MLGVAVLLLAVPEVAGIEAQAAMAFVTTNLGWLYLVFGMVALFFSVWLAFGPYGHVKLGQPDEPVEYSNLHWIALMFTAGIGGNLAAWGFAEPVFYLQTPPFGVEPHSTMAVEWAHVYPLFHWGVIPWAIYAVPAVPIAYMLFVRRDPILRISAACEEALPERGRESSKSLIDILIVLGLIGGASTTLGLGVPFVSALVTELIGVEDSLPVKFTVLSLWTLLFGASAYRGLKKGIKVLADFNMALAIVSILFVLFAGPTLFILSLTTNSVGMLLDNFWAMSFWTDPINKSGFPEAWTVFYWAWWLAYAAFMGLFVGRISRGRTIRQVIVGVILWGGLGTCFFLAVAGGQSLHQEVSGLYPVSETLAERDMFYLATQMLIQLPFDRVILTVFTVMCIVFYATTMDSAAYVLSSICTKRLRSDQEPPRYSRLVWAFALAMLTAGLVVSERLSIVQSSTIVFSVPLIPIVILMCITVVKWLKHDHGEAVQQRKAGSRPSTERQT